MRQTISACILMTFSWIFRKLPTAWRVRLTGFLAWIYGSFPHAQTEAVRFNYERLFSIQGNRLKNLSRLVFKNFGLVLYDFFNPQGLEFEIGDKARLEEWRARYQGLMILTFHMGLWESGARILASWGWPTTAIYQPYENKLFKKMINQRRAEGVNYIPVGAGAARAVSQALKRGDVVAMLGDQNFGEEGTVVNLWGHKIKWPRGPMVLAVKEMAPIIVTGIIQTDPRHYRAIVFDPLIPKRRSPEEVEELTQKVADRFGQLLKAYPSQWYRFRPLEFMSKETAAPTMDDGKELIGAGTARNAP